MEESKSYTELHRVHTEFHKGFLWRSALLRIALSARLCVHSV
jgi:hypothetical protein